MMSCGCWVKVINFVGYDSCGSRSTIRYEIGCIHIRVRGRGKSRGFLSTRIKNVLESKGTCECTQERTNPKYPMLCETALLFRNKYRSQGTSRIETSFPSHKCTCICQANEYRICLMSSTRSIKSISNKEGENKLHAKGTS
uniref:Uncharacterized protein n=1 Tax=Lepeophtheirus salmonis TaxID=72036 RepID=A0A0K2UMR6_LEPSM